MSEPVWEANDTFWDNGVHWVIINPEWPLGDKHFSERCGGCELCDGGEAFPSGAEPHCATCRCHE